MELAIDRTIKYAIVQAVSWQLSQIHATVGDSDFSLISRARLARWVLHVGIDN